MSKYFKEVDGDLLEFPEGISVIGHCANTRSCFGAGIAAQIRKNYPKAAEADKNFEYEEGVKRLGKFSSFKFLGEDDKMKVIVNIYGQLDPSTEKRAVNYEAIALGIERLMARAAQSKGPPVIGFPKFMGCQLAGGDWPIVEAMIKTYAEKHKVQTIIVNWTKN